MDDAQILRRLAELGLELPDPPAPVASYVPCVISGGFAFVAGQVPQVDGRVMHPGHVGQAVGEEQAAESAARAALQALSVLRAELGGSFDRLERIVQVTVYVSAPPGFSGQPQVANGASDLLVSVLGDEGRHARAAIGVSSLPLRAPVEVAVTAAVGPA